MGDFCGSFVNRENRSLFSKVRPLLAQVWDLPSTLNCKISISLDNFWKLAFMVTEAKNSLLGPQYSLLGSKIMYWDLQIWRSPPLPSRIY